MASPVALLTSTQPQEPLWEALRLGPEALRFLGPLCLAVGAAWILDLMCRRRGLMPPGFRRPWRRAAAAGLVAAILWIGIFSPLSGIGTPLKQEDLSKVPAVELFLLHALMAAAVLGWFALGFAVRRPAAPATPAMTVTRVLPAMSAPEAQAALDGPEALGAPALDVPALDEARPAESGAMEPVAGPRPPGFGREVARQLGLVAPSIRREVAIGAALGLAAWAAVLLALVATALAVWAVGGEGALPKPSAIVPWIAALPIAVRALVSLSAGFVEEIFFRGFLQPRIGILLSTAFFVLAHVSYGQPLMLVGITLLSLIYALLVRWRQTIWPAIAAHALFDGIQLLVIIPAALRLMGQPGGVR
jgi:membrane protease YdiL (CAAX protease family)